MLRNSSNERSVPAPKFEGSCSGRDRNTGALGAHSNDYVYKGLHVVRLDGVAFPASKSDLRAGLSLSTPRHRGGAQHGALRFFVFAAAAS